MMTNSQSTAFLVTKTVDTPRIYLACLAAYNNGRLHGAWVDADQGTDHIWSELRKMLRASPEPDAEEWAIHGAIRKSHLLSEVETPLVEPSRPFLAGACELGNWLVRSLRKRLETGSHTPVTRARRRSVPFEPSCCLGRTVRSSPWGAESRSCPRRKRSVSGRCPSWKVSRIS